MSPSPPFVEFRNNLQPGLPLMLDRYSVSVCCKKEEGRREGGRGGSFQMPYHTHQGCITPRPLSPTQVHLCC